MRNIEINTVSQNDIEACVKLTHRHFELSLSTIFGRPEFRVFLKRVSGKSEDVTHLFFPQSDGVPPTAANVAEVVRKIEEGAKLAGF